MGYINSQGISNGPIKLQHSDGTNYSGTWIAPAPNNGIKIVPVPDQWYSEFYGPIYAYTPVSIPESGSITLDALDSKCVATVGWVMSYVSKGIGTDINLNNYVDKEQFNGFQDQVIENKNNITAHGNRLNILEADVNILKNFKSAIDIRVTNVENSLDRLWTAHNTHLDNPFPDGVIFIAGNAEGV